MLAPEFTLCLFLFFPICSTGCTFAQSLPDHSVRRRCQRDSEGSSPYILIVGKRMGAGRAPRRRRRLSEDTSRKERFDFIDGSEMLILLEVGIGVESVRKIRYGGHPSPPEIQANRKGGGGGLSYLFKLRLPITIFLSQAPQPYAD